MALVSGDPSLATKAASRYGHRRLMSSLSVWTPNEAGRGRSSSSSRLFATSKFSRLRNGCQR